MVRRTKVRSKPKAEKTKERSVLEMTPPQARRFFLKAESYCSVDLPAYFQFSTILSAVAKVLKGKRLTDMSSKPHQYEGVNYSLLSNKDGRHAWRPFKLIHPALYVSLVNHLTEPHQWEVILDRFKIFRDLMHFNCLSIPVGSLSKRKDKEVQVLQWWQGIEQQSIALAMEYEYVFHTDITDCYASIYTHSIVWALHGKEFAKSNRRDATLIGNIIDCHMQDMQHGQTNGIPQGSVLMDFIAEMLLGYVDLELNDRLSKKGISDYHLLRYRDDYRIFINNPQLGEAVLKELTEVLINLGLKLNASKTTCFQSVISSSLKQDKLAWIRTRQDDKNIQKYLFIIHAHGMDYQNAGSLVVALTHFYRRLNRLKKVQNPHVLISISTDIAYNSPRTVPICTAIISKLLSFIKDKDVCKQILEKIHKKLSRFPNTGLMEVWLQRIGYSYDFNPDYTENLCTLVQDQKKKIWNNDWITCKALKEASSAGEIINTAIMMAMKPIIAPKEIELFASEWY